MSLLVALLGLFAISLTVAIVILLLSPAEPSRTREAPQGWKRRPFSALTIEQAFDPDRSAIWDTQIPALQLIASAGRKGLALEDLHRLYDVSARRYPELYDGCSFQGWLEFLRQTQLVSVGLYKVLLMPEGKEFLQYLVESGNSQRQGQTAGAPRR